MLRRLTTFLLLGVLILGGCLLVQDHYGEAVVSPSGNYAVYATVNRTDQSSNDYTHVMIHLTDATGTGLFQVYRSRAGDVMKWALGWMENEDIVILQSSDLGSMAFRIENDRLVEIDPISDEMFDRAETLKAEKY